MSDAISVGTGVAKKKRRISCASASETSVIESDIPSLPVNLEDCSLTPLSDSQVLNVMSELENYDINKLLCEIPMPAEPPTCTRQQTFNYNNISKLQNCQPHLPAIYAQNVVINYNMYQKWKL